jgi:hypothetical protein
MPEGTTFSTLALISVPLQAFLRDAGKIGQRFLGMPV